MFPIKVFELIVFLLNRHQNVKCISLFSLVIYIVNVFFYILYLINCTNLFPIRLHLHQRFYSQINQFLCWPNLSEIFNYHIQFIRCKSIFITIFTLFADLIFTIKYRFLKLHKIVMKILNKHKYSNLSIRLNIQGQIVLFYLC